MKGALELYRRIRDGKTVIAVRVVGNVGDDNRAKLDALNILPVVGITNCREIVTTTPEQLDAIRNALVAQDIVNGPNK